VKIYRSLQSLFSVHKSNSSLSVWLLLSLAVIAGCQGESAPEIPVTLKDSVVVDSGVYGSGEQKRLEYSEERDPCSIYNPLRDPFFGDTHVHSERSLDAGIQDTRTSPAQSYEFAKGKTLGLQPWIDDDTALRSATISRPLDFAMVSDHAEFFGETVLCQTPGVDDEAYNSEKCSNFRDDPRGDFVNWNLKYLGNIFQNDGVMKRFEFCGENGKKCLDASESVWQEMITAAEDAYDKTDECGFTAFVGYEYTGAPLSFNLHRNVVFKNADVPGQPLGYMEYSKPENLWKGLDKYCNEDTNCESLTIPHNSNMSGDMMFRRDKYNIQRTDFTPDYVQLRNKYEPLLEIYQHKGDSECQRGGKNGADEFCGFEKFPFNNLIADRFNGFLTGEPGEQSFLRYALAEGLNQENIHGVNPFKYGVVGSTDTHLGTPGLVDEAEYPGHGGAGADNGGSTEVATGLTDLISFGPGGLAVLWAEENSRDYLFDAMQRKETHATSGPRILVRMFAGWSDNESGSDEKSSELTEQALCDGFAFDETGEALRIGAFPSEGDRYGVPMGSDLPAYPGHGSPVFAVAALRDRDSSQGLQRIQIVKTWIDETGENFEQVFDVVGAGLNGVESSASVDLNTCVASQPDKKEALCSVWKDPSFNASQDAAYYARVLENPSCRWAWRQCVAYLNTTSFSNMREACAHPSQMDSGFNECCLHEYVADVFPGNTMKTQIGIYPATTQERAWTSSIWYNAISSSERSQ